MSTVFYPQETSYSPSYLNVRKRSCFRLLPTCFKSKAPSKGIELSWLTIIQAICLPLVLVAVDVGSDGNMLSFMNSFTNGTINTFNSTDDNLTEQNNSTISAEKENQRSLGGLLAASGIILIFSVLNLIYGNPAKTLFRNARTLSLMASREMESKDAPQPIGDYIDIFEND